jgi:hypothetical protein
MDLRVQIVVVGNKFLKTDDRLPHDTCGGGSRWLFRILDKVRVFEDARSAPLGQSGCARPFAGAANGPDRPDLPKVRVHL